MPFCPRSATGLMLLLHWRRLNWRDGHGVGVDQIGVGGLLWPGGGCGDVDALVAAGAMVDGHHEDHGRPGGEDVDHGDQLDEEGDGELPFEAADRGEDDGGEEIEGIVEEVAAEEEAGE